MSIYYDVSIYDLFIIYLLLSCSILCAALHSSTSCCAKWSKNMFFEKITYSKVIGRRDDDYDDGDDDDDDDDDGDGDGDDDVDDHVDDCDDDADDHVDDNDDGDNFDDDFDDDDDYDYVDDRDDVDVDVVEVFWSGLSVSRREEIIEESLITSSQRVMFVFSEAHERDNWTSSFSSPSSLSSSQSSSSPSQSLSPFVVIIVIPVTFIQSSVGSL